VGRVAVAAKARITGCEVRHYPGTWPIGSSVPMMVFTATGVPAGVPDFRAELLRSAHAEDACWAGWYWHGNRVDGIRLEVRWAEGRRFDGPTRTS
jgi:hypothetical protein